jgi:alpha-L-arabinofuranosidase
VRGYSDAATYARKYLRYREAMRAVDPSIRFIAVGRDRTDWNEQVLALAGRSIDLLSIHHYDGPSETQDARFLAARPLHWEAYYRELGQTICARVPGADIPLIVNEWNSVLPLPRQHSMESAVFGARMLNVFERSSPLVAMTAVSDLVNGWPGGIIQAGRHGAHVTPTYRAIELYNRFLGAERVETTVEGSTFDVPDGPAGVTWVDVTASRSSDGRRYYLKAVNTNLQAGARVRVAIDGWRPAARATQHTLAATTPGAANTFATPDAVAVRSKAIAAGPRFTIDLPAASVAVVVLAAGAGATP